MRVALLFAIVGEHIHNAGALGVAWPIVAGRDRTVDNVVHAIIEDLAVNTAQAGCIPTPEAMVKRSKCWVCVGRLVATAVVVYLFWSPLFITSRETPSHAPPQVIVVRPGGWVRHIRCRV